jgi:hypothetical protein
MPQPSQGEEETTLTKVNDSATGVNVGQSLSAVRRARLDWGIPL